VDGLSRRLALQLYCAVLFCAVVDMMLMSPSLFLLKLGEVDPDL